MVRAGADCIDIGGESTRPGASAVSVDRECRRVVPVIKRLARTLRVPISIDTRKAVVAQAALGAGATIINDVSGFGYDPEMARVAARARAVVILMHMRGTPGTMQRAPRYGDVVAEVKQAFRCMIARARAAGIPASKIVVDPGIGFGKTARHNCVILNRLHELCSLGYPVCVGLSRKSFIGTITKRAQPEERVTGTVAANAVAIRNGARIIRVHDVAQARETAAVVDSIIRESVCEK